MKNNKRWMRLVSFMMCVVFLLLAFAGCGKKKSTAGSTKENTPVVPTTPDPETVESGINAKNLTPPVTTLTDSADFAKMSDIQLSRFAGAEGMVLLENSKGTLPLTKNDKVALFGEAQVNFIKGGTGSGDVNALYVVNALDGLRIKEAEGKVKLYAPLSAQYEKKPSYVPTKEVIAAAKAECNKAVVFISRNSGENIDVVPAKYNLTTAEKALLNNVCSAGFDGVTVILNIGTIMDTSFLKDYPQIDSLLIAWQAGMEGGNALADVLVGDVNVSGKLVDTMASSYKDYPSSKNFSSETVYATYTEDVFVGYRYFETFDPTYQKVNYPFGYGLSYTTFDISTPTVLCDGNYIEATVTVKNTGKMAGMEVVQLYYSAPMGVLGAPGKVLAAFAKTKLLSAGESQELKLTFAVSDMARFDDTGKISQYAYVMEKGAYHIYLGNSIKNAGERGIVHTYNLTEDTITLQLSDVLSEVTLTKRLCADGSYEDVYTGTASIALSAGTTILSACDYLVQYNQTQLDANKDGSVYGMVQKGGNTLIYTVSAAKGGSYTLSIGYGAAGKDSLPKAISIKVNGKKQPMELPANGTGGKFTIKQTVEMPIELKEGINRIELTIRAGIDKEILISNLTFSDDSGAGVTDLRTKPQGVFDPKDQMSFLEVYEDPTKLEDFLNTLSPAEMIHLLCGHGANVGRGDGSLAGLTAKDVPYVDTSDGPAGLDLAVAQVAWPIETSLACTWNTQLVYEVGKQVGKECYKAGVDIWLAPGINIHRDPLGGRNFEYFSEDPLLTGKMASALTQGVQSIKGVGVMIKHLYANSREVMRVDGDSHISLRAAREIYLKAFEICVKEADPWSVMTTYNTANGMFNSENRELLTDILRGEWGFKGFVCTDWGAHSQQFREIAAGNDAKMSWGYPESTLAAYRCGELSYIDLKNSARRMLEIAVKSGSLERKLNPVIPVHTIEGTAATRIKASELADRSEGVGFDACTDVGGGTNPNYCQDGRFISYKLDVKTPGVYNMAFRVAANHMNGSFTVYLDGKKVDVFKWAEGSGGWQNWKTISSDIVLGLTEGEHTLKLVFGNAINLNWIALTPKA